MEDKKISIYDPIADAYREVPISLAKKFVANCSEVVEQIAKAKLEDNQPEIKN